MSANPFRKLKIFCKALTNHPLEKITHSLPHLPLPITLKRLLCTGQVGSQQIMFPDWYWPEKTWFGVSYRFPNWSVRVKKSGLISQFYCTGQKSGVGSAASGQPSGLGSSESRPAWPVRLVGVGLVGLGPPCNCLTPDKSTCLSIYHTWYIYQ